MWQIETLAKKHDRSPFGCGEDDLDTWLKTQASQSGRSNNTLTRVLVDGDDPRVLGYYSQSSYRLVGDELGAVFGDGRRPRYPIPCVLLARLARCNSVAGRGAGEVLLGHALRACTRVSREIGIEMVVVHALHERAALFYERFGFVRFVDDDLSLMLPTKTLQDAFSD
ncbi:GNAT family N-acetyltransferase [Leucobacter chromiireducens]|uniref:GNAT family N-acetyltransferase n=1 Tax=Leucobacter chromiireducens TaxID=283877 RepID=UPI000F63CDF8|nr:GNAT family N-acetyltransferase [Leucobacter chromiireducens]